MEQCDMCGKPMCDVCGGCGCMGNECSCNIGGDDEDMPEEEL